MVELGTGRPIRALGTRVAQTQEVHNSMGLMACYTDVQQPTLGQLRTLPIPTRIRCKQMVEEPAARLPLLQQILLSNDWYREI